MSKGDKRRKADKRYTSDKIIEQNWPKPEKEKDKNVTDKSKSGSSGKS